MSETTVGAHMTGSTCILCVVGGGVLTHDHANPMQHVLAAAAYVLSECEDDGVPEVLRGLCAAHRTEYNGTTAAWHAYQARSVS